MLLLISLALSIPMYVIAVRTVRKSGRPSEAIKVGILGGGFGYWCLAFFPAHILSGLLLAATALACTVVRDGGRRFARWAAVAMSAAYLLVGLNSLFIIRDRMHLREAYPEVSLADRLTYETTSPARQAPGAWHGSTADASLEERLEGSRRIRTWALRALHENTLADFVESPGFGIARHLEPSPQLIDLQEPGPIPFPSNEEPASASLQPVPAPPRPDDAALGELHWSGVVDFVNVAGFGYVRDQEHVRGFVPHQFHEFPRLEKQPGTPRRWRVSSLELVSLLKFKEPAVYLSRHLPRMDELRDAPTRPLDSFEAEALGYLRGGSDVKVETTAEQLRMLGSVRAARICLDCHHVSRGALLGAFSYVLKPAGSAP